MITHFLENSNKDLLDTRDNNDVGYVEESLHTQSLNQINPFGYSQYANDKFNKYSVIPNRFESAEELYKQRAKHQPWYEQAFKATLQFADEAVGIGMLIGFGNLLDAIATTGDHGDYTNQTLEKLEEIKENINKQLEIYRENPDKSWDVTDNGWWANNIVQLGSAIQLLIPTKLIMNVGKLGKLGRISFAAAKHLNNAGKLTKSSYKLAKGFNTGAEVLGSAFLSRTMENYQEARETWKNNYSSTISELKDIDDTKKQIIKQRYELDENSTDDDIARAIAGKNSDEVFAQDYWMLAMDILQFASVAKGLKGTYLNKNSFGLWKQQQKNLRTLAGKTGEELEHATLKNKAGDVARYTLSHPLTILQASEISEGFEEMFQGIQQAKANDNVKALFHSDFTPRNLTSYLRDSEIWEQGFWGWIGGGIFSGIHAATDYYKNKKEQEAIDKWNDANPNHRIYSEHQKDLNSINNAFEQTRKFAKLLKAVKKGYNPFTYTINPLTGQREQVEITDSDIENDDLLKEKLEVLKETDKDIVFRAIVEDYITNLAMQSSERGIGDLLEEYINSPELKQYLKQADSNINDELFDSLGKRLTDINNNYYNTYYKFENDLDGNIKEDNINPYALQIITREKVQNDLEKQRLEDLKKINSTQLNELSEDSINEQNYLLGTISDKIQKHVKYLREQNDKIEESYKNHAISKTYRDLLINENNKTIERLLTNFYDSEELIHIEHVSDELKNLRNDNKDEFLKKFEEFIKKYSIYTTPSVNVGLNIHDAVKKKLNDKAELEFRKALLNVDELSTKQDVIDRYNDVTAQIEYEGRLRYQDSLDMIEKLAKETENPDELFNNIMEEENLTDEQLEAIQILKLGNPDYYKYLEKIKDIISKRKNEINARNSTPAPIEIENNDKEESNEETTEETIENEKTNEESNEVEDDEEENTAQMEAVEVQDEGVEDDDEAGIEAASMQEQRTVEEQLITLISVHLGDAFKTLYNIRFKNKSKIDSTYTLGDAIYETYREFATQGFDNKKGEVIVKTIIKRLRSETNKAGEEIYKAYTDIQLSSYIKPALKYYISGKLEDYRENNMSPEQYNAWKAVYEQMIQTYDQFDRNIGKVVLNSSTQTLNDTEIDSLIENLFNDFIRDKFNTEPEEYTVVNENGKKIINVDKFFEYVYERTYYIYDCLLLFNKIQNYLINQEKENNNHNFFLTNTKLFKDNANDVRSYIQKLLNNKTFNVDNCFHVDQPTQVKIALDAIRKEVRLKFSSNTITNEISETTKRLQEEIKKQGSILQEYYNNLEQAMYITTDENGNTVLTQVHYVIKYETNPKSLYYQKPLSISIRINPDDPKTEIGFIGLVDLDSDNNGYHLSFKGSNTIYSHVRKDGTQIISNLDEIIEDLWFSDTSNPVIDKLKELIHSANITTDVTDLLTKDRKLFDNIIEYLNKKGEDAVKKGYINPFEKLSKSKDTKDYLLKAVRQLGDIINFNAELGIQNMMSPQASFNQYKQRLFDNYKKTFDLQTSLFQGKKVLGTFATNDKLMIDNNSVEPFEISWENEDFRSEFEPKIVIVGLDGKLHYENGHVEENNMHYSIGSIGIKVTNNRQSPGIIWMDDSSNITNNKNKIGKLVETELNQQLNKYFNNEIGFNELRQTFINLIGKNGLFRGLTIKDDNKTHNSFAIYKTEINQQGIPVETKIINVYRHNQNDNSLNGAIAYTSGETRVNINKVDATNANYTNMINDLVSSIKHRALLYGVGATSKGRNPYYSRSNGFHITIAGQTLSYNNYLDYCLQNRAFITSSKIGIGLNTNYEILQGDNYFSIDEEATPKVVTTTKYKNASEYMAQATKVKSVSAKEALRLSHQLGLIKDAINKTSLYLQDIEEQIDNLFYYTFDNGEVLQVLDDKLYYDENYNKEAKKNGDIQGANANMYYDKKTKRIYVTKKGLETFKLTDDEGFNHPYAFQVALIHENIHKHLDNLSEEERKYIFNQLYDVYQQLLVDIRGDISIISSKTEALTPDEENILQIYNKLLTFNKEKNIGSEFTIEENIKLQSLYDIDRKAYDKKLALMMEEFLVESLSQSGMIKYLSSKEYNGAPIIIEEHKKNLFEKILDILLQVFFNKSLDDYIRGRENSLFGQQIKILSSYNNPSGTIQQPVAPIVNEEKVESKDDNKTPPVEGDTNKETEDNTTLTDTTKTPRRKRMLPNNKPEVDEFSQFEDNLPKRGTRNSTGMFLTDIEMRIKDYDTNPANKGSFGIVEAPSMNDFVNAFGGGQKLSIAKMIANGEIEFVCKY